MKIRKHAGNFVYLLVFAIICLLMVLPFVFVISGSLKTDYDFIQNPLRVIPEQAVLDNYRNLFAEIPFGRQFTNSIIIAVSATLLSIVGSCLIAFGFSTYDFKGKKILFGIMLATMFIPPSALLVPQFQLFRGFGWINTWWPLIVPGMFNVFYIYLLTQLMKGIPRDLYDCATIDGCTDLRIMFSIVMPLIKGGIGVVAVLRFMGSWNDFMTPLIYINKTELQTLPVGLKTLSRFHEISYGTTMAGAFLASLPIIVLLVVVGKKYMVSGLTAGAVKG